jgi:hypothetical protein
MTITRLFAAACSPSSGILKVIVQTG